MILSFVLTFFLSGYASEREKADAYYAGFNLHAQDATVLRDTLHKLLSSSHQTQSNAPDKLTNSCDTQSKNCFSHVNLGYHKARQFLFGDIHLNKNNGDLAVEDYYCGTIYTNNDFPKDYGLGENKIPDPNILNTEHSWPQFRFTDQFPRPMQKADLHILFPVNQEVNSIRGSYHFGEVEKVDIKACDQAALGKSKEQQTVFEPMDKRKGDVARALFYFAIRYKTNIEKSEEAYLKKWHQQDPVDQEETERNNAVFSKQWNRNPFVDHPELINKISDF